MKRKQQIFSLKQLGSSLFMIATLLWLTVSTPFVYAADQVQKKEAQKQSDESKNQNPFSNTTEEKNESGVNTLSEFLHEHQLIDQQSITFVRYYKCYPSDLYIEYHPELISPPPEI